MISNRGAKLIETFQLALQDYMTCNREQRIEEMKKVTISKLNLTDYIRELERECDMQKPLTEHEAAREYFRQHG